MSEDFSSYYETRLQHEITEIETRIRELVLEKRALERQLMKARRENADLRDVNRKNSVNRVLIERRVLDALKNAGRPMFSKDLHREAKYVDFDLKENTFRTILHRMKLKALIIPTSQPGLWQLPLVA